MRIESIRLFFDRPFYNFGKIDILNSRHKQYVLVNLIRNGKATKKGISYLQFFRLPINQNYYSSGFGYREHLSVLLLHFYPLSGLQYL